MRKTYLREASKRDSCLPRLLWSTEVWNMYLDSLFSFMSLICSYYMYFILNKSWDKPVSLKLSRVLQPIITFKIINTSRLDLSN